MKGEGGWGPDVESESEFEDDDDAGGWFTPCRIARCSDGDRVLCSKVGTVDSRCFGTASSGFGRDPPNWVFRRFNGGALCNMEGASLDSSGGFRVNGWGCRSCLSSWVFCRFLAV